MCAKFSLIILSLVILFTIIESRKSASRDRVRVVKSTKQGKSKAVQGRSGDGEIGPQGKDETVTEATVTNATVTDTNVANLVDTDANNPDAPITSSKWKFLGNHNSQSWYMSKIELSVEDAHKECEHLEKEYGIKKGKFDLDFVLPKPNGGQNEEVIIKLLHETKEDNVWTGATVDLNDLQRKTVVAKRSENGQRLVKMENDKTRFKRTSGKHPKLVSYSIGGAPTPSRKRRVAFSSRDGSNKKNHRKRQVALFPGIKVTVTETHYPWLSSFGNEIKPCENFRACDPIVCNVTTTACAIENMPCEFGNKTTCSIINTGKCSAICESCEIERVPDCWMADNKCTVVKDRVCTMSEPVCTAVAPPCTVVRPPCVTKQSPCKIKLNVTQRVTECKLPPSCGGQPTVKKVSRECTPEETASGLTSCSTLTISPICMMPEYCRMGGVLTEVDCEPPTTFCPPEIVKCPPPDVQCEEPKLTCSEPEINCPPPKAMCSQPRVTCTSPKVSCPTVITQCANPTANCPPPKIVCDEPVWQCSEPKPCFVPKTQEMCEPEECKDPNICQCYVARNRETYKAQIKICEEKHKAFCYAKENPKEAAKAAAAKEAAEIEAAAKEDGAKETTTTEAAANEAATTEAAAKETTTKRLIHEATEKPED